MSSSKRNRSMNRLIVQVSEKGRKIHNTDEKIAPKFTTQPSEGRLNAAFNMNTDLIYRKDMLSFMVNISLLLTVIVKSQRYRA